MSIQSHASFGGLGRSLELSDSSIQFVVFVTQPVADVLSVAHEICSLDALTDKNRNEFGYSDVILTPCHGTVLIAAWGSSGETLPA